MSVTIKYTKAQYQAKITELEGYYALLEQHLSSMENLKESMFQFWEDENARTTGMILNGEIEQVKKAMTRTSDLLIFYKSSVEKLSGADASVRDLLGDALSIITGLSIS